MKTSWSGLLRLLVALVLLLIGALCAVYWIRPGLDQLAAHPYVEPPAPGAQAVYATWFGTTAVLLDDGHDAVFIDPFLTRPPGFLPLLLNRPIAPDAALIDAALARSKITHLDAVAVSHSHYDHSMDAGVVAQRTGAPLVGSESTANVGRGAGLPESRLVVMGAGRPDTFVAGAFTLRFIEARHAGATGGSPTGDITAPLTPPAPYLDYRQGGTWSIVISHPRGTILHHGSAGFVPGALRGVHADVVFLGIALIDDLPAYLREVVDTVGARRVIPVHWDDFTRPLDEPLRPLPLAVRLDRFFARVDQERPDLSVQALEPGRRVLLLP
jgi:L-ascorbate metabolism protein UlaG (beta-lactamase superfamily)